MMEERIPRTSSQEQMDALSAGLSVSTLPGHAAPALGLQEQAQVGLPENPEDLEDGGPGRRAVNATAYRIFKLLQWLIESPLSVEELNRRFVADSKIGKKLSNDSVWLYINTLKALGCRIRRPGPKNGFRYELQYHPFGLPLTDAQLEMLSLAKAHAQQMFNHQEMLVLDRLLKKIVHYAACENPRETIDRLFSKSRSFDYETCRQHIEALERWVVAEQLLLLTYQSPLKGQETFHFLPEFLYYEQGVVYVRGERPDFPEPSSLRLDRIVGMEGISDAELSDALRDRRAWKTEVLIRLDVFSADAFQGFELNEAHGVYEETLLWQEEADRTGYQVRLMVRDFFYLRQRLLSCGFAFQVLSPVEFREELISTLSVMKRLYESGEVNHGPG
ncbi:MAG TPA: WYL domain-containing protein [Coleofasciculaceae cyanobacterium]